MPPPWDSREDLMITHVQCTAREALNTYKVLISIIFIAAGPDLPPALQVFKSPLKLTWSVLSIRIPLKDKWLGQKTSLILGADMSAVPQCLLQTVIWTKCVPSSLDVKTLTPDGMAFGGGPLGGSRLRGGHEGRTFIVRLVPF